MGRAKVYVDKDPEPIQPSSPPKTSTQPSRPSRLRLEDETEKKVLTPKEYVEVRTGAMARACLREIRLGRAGGDELLARSLSRRLGLQVVGAI